MENTWNAEALDFAAGFDYGADGRVRNPGKYEAEPEWVVYYDFLASDGYGDDITGTEDYGRIDVMFTVTDADRARWPDLRDETAQCIVVTETDDGFVHGCTCTMEEWERFVAEQSADDSEETAEDGTPTGTSDDPRTRGC